MTYRSIWPTYVSQSKEFGFESSKVLKFRTKEIAWDYYKALQVLQFQKVLNRFKIGCVKRKLENKMIYAKRQTFHINKWNYSNRCSVPTCYPQPDDKYGDLRLARWVHAHTESRRISYEQKTIHTLQHAPYTEKEREREDQFESNESNIKRLSIDASVYSLQGTCHLIQKWFWITNDSITV